MTDQELNITPIKDDMDYYAIPALSASAVKTFAENPLTFWQRTPLNPNRGEDKITDAMQRGRLAHCLLLDPDSFATDFLVNDDWGKSRINKKYTDLINAQMALNGGKFINIVNTEEYEWAKKMTNAIKAHPLAGQLLTGIHSEKPFMFNDEITGLPCKSKLDGIKQLQSGEIIIVDYKTTSDFQDYLSPFRFERTYNWLQSAFYRKCILKLNPDLVKLEQEHQAPLVRFFFIVQSSIEGQEDMIATFEHSLNLYALADAELANQLALIKACFAKQKSGKNGFVFEQTSLHDTFELECRDLECNSTKILKGIYNRY